MINMRKQIAMGTSLPVAQASQISSTPAPKVKRVAPTMPAVPVVAKPKKGIV